ncbi:hypothetical protein EXIGLDRAFT_771980 [Exidia glandulosa HHB12029]|uniref:Glucose receptor Git3 N-terminal domain-containing protein n=1 Tax=Exidia glandulosa HHB12029 TaxID=1314781 RepID=A0A165FLK5_EXIGL|nr:hypothetical protein EXIGLDRAFT_771980 [Exidia glandulosa HHB12029]
MSWIFIVLAVGVPYGIHGRDGYIGINGPWCWISATYPIERLALEYAWLWAAGLLVVILYIPLFFALRGNIVVAKLVGIIS